MRAGATATPPQTKSAETQNHSNTSNFNPFAPPPASLHSSVTSLPPPPPPPPPPPSAPPSVSFDRTAVFNPPALLRIDSPVFLTSIPSKTNSPRDNESPSSTSPQTPTFNSLAPSTPLSPLSPLEKFIKTEHFNTDAHPDTDIKNTDTLQLSASSSSLLVTSIPVQVDPASISSQNESHLSATQLSVYVVMSAVFVDWLLHSLPIAFLPVLLEQAGNSRLEIGLLFGMKPLTQVLVNPITGLITNRFGPRIPMIVGTFVVLFSTLLCAFVPITSYYLLCFGRGFTGVGSSAAFVAGMAHIAKVYPVDEERGEAIGKAMGGIGLAVLMGPPMGGILYDINQSKATPFLAAAAIIVLQLLLLVYVFYFSSAAVLYHRNPQPASTEIQLQPRNETQGIPASSSTPPRSSDLKSPSSFLAQFRPLTDPLILLVCFCVVLIDSSVAMLEYIGPLYLDSRYHASASIIGLLFLPDCAGYSVLTPLIGKYGVRYGRVTMMMIGMTIFSVTLSVFTIPNTVVGQILMTGGIGMAVAFVEGSFAVLLSNLLDLRHPELANQEGGGYGIVMALEDTSVSMGFVLGSFAGSALNEAFGFDWSCRSLGLVALIFMPMLVLVRKYDGMTLVTKYDVSKIEQHEKTRTQRENEHEQKQTEQHELQPELQQLQPKTIDGEEQNQVVVIIPRNETKEDNEEKTTQRHSVKITSSPHPRNSLIQSIARDLFARRMTISRTLEV